MSTEEIDVLVYDFTTSHGAIPAPLNYEGFPKSVCTSINDVVCHGIPNKNEILKAETLSMWTFLPFTKDISLMHPVCL